MSQGRSGSRAVARPHPQEVAGPRLRVHERQRISARTLLLTTVLLAFVVLAGAVAIQAERTKTQHSIDRLERDLADAQAEYRLLRAEVASASAPARILAAAAALDLVEPEGVVPLRPVDVAAVSTRGGEDVGTDDRIAGAGVPGSIDLAQSAGGASLPTDEVAG